MGHGVGHGHFDAYGYLRHIGGDSRFGVGASVESRLSESWAAFGSVELGALYRDEQSELEMAAMMGLRARW